MIVFTLIQLTNQMRYIQITFKMTFQMTFQMTFIMTIEMKFQTSPRITFRMTFLLINFNFFSSTPKSQKSNVWCLKVLSFSQHLQCPIPIIIYVKCPISILQNSWRLEILSELPLFELDSKAALARFFVFLNKYTDTYFQLRQSITIHFYIFNTHTYHWCLHDLNFF